METLSSPWHGSMTGLMVTFDDVYTLDSQNGYSSIVSLHFPTSPDADYFIAPSTIFVPSEHRDDIDRLLSFYDHTVIWDTSTHLCVDNCTGITALASAIDLDLPVFSLAGGTAGC
jgi:hypothetical protein